MEDRNTGSLRQRLMLAAGVTKESALAAQLDISSQAVYNAFKKEQIPASWIFQVSSTFGVSSDWIFYGTGSMMRDCIGQDEQRNQGDLSGELIMIPMVEARLSAGGGSFETNDCVEERSYSFRRDFLTRKGNPKNMVLMRVSGDSMTPEIMDNDVVLIDQSKTDIIQGKMFAVGFEDCIYLKRIDLLPRKVILKSTNNAYPPIELGLQEDMTSLFRVIGKVLWCGREYL